MASERGPRRRRALPILLTVGAIVVALPLAGLAVFAATFVPDQYKAQIVDAVRRSTGRELLLQGRLGLKFSLWPTFEAWDVALANIPGGSRQQMLTVARFEAQVAVLPLLRHRLEIDRVVLVGPDLLLETDAEGRPNWRFRPAASPSGAPPSAPGRPATPLALDLRAVRVEDGRVTYRDGTTGRGTTVALRRFDATTPPGGGPVRVRLDAAYREAPFDLAGTVGPIAALLGGVPTAPWPVRLTLSGAGATLAFDGTLARPAEGPGYQGRLQAQIPDLAPLTSFFPRAGLPPLRDIHAAVEVVDTGGRWPETRDLVARVGASDLAALLPGLRLEALDLAAPRPDQPARVTAAGSLGTMPLQVTATLDPVAALVAAAGPYRLDASAEAGGARLAAKGTIADPRTLGGADLALTAQVPDLAALAPLARRPLPAWRDIAGEARLLTASEGPARGLALRSIALRSPPADLAGEAALDRSGRPSLQARLASDHVDMDALLAALPPRPVQPPAVEPVTAAPPAPPQMAEPARPAGSGRLFSDRPIPFDLLRLGDADLSVAITALRVGGLEYRDIRSHLALEGGRLALDPLAARFPAGRLDARLSADATGAEPAVAVAARGSQVPIEPFVALLGEPGDLSGAADLDLDLRGVGRTAHVLAAGAEGRLGVALVDGAIGNRFVSGTLGQVLRRAGLPDVTARPGRTAIRCLALRLDAAHGLATVRALLLDTSLFHLEGDGALNLADETMALRLRPLARLGGTGVIVPLRLDGPLLAPKVEVDAKGMPTGASANTPMGLIIGALGGDRMIAGAGSDDCARQLGIARVGRPGPLPAASPERPAGPKPADLLRQFLR